MPCHGDDRHLPALDQGVSSCQYRKRRGCGRGEVMPRSTRDPDTPAGPWWLPGLIRILRPAPSDTVNQGWKWDFPLTPFVNVTMLFCAFGRIPVGGGTHGPTSLPMRLT